MACSASQARCGRTETWPSSRAIQTAIWGALRRGAASPGACAGRPGVRASGAAGASRCDGGRPPAHQDRRRCSGWPVAPANAARSRSWPRPPRARGPAPEARSPDSGARHRPPGSCAPATPVRPRSDDPRCTPSQPPTPGAQSLKPSHAQGDPPESIIRKRYETAEPRNFCHGRSRWKPVRPGTAHKFNSDAGRYDRPPAARCFRSTTVDCSPSISVERSTRRNRDAQGPRADADGVNRGGRHGRCRESPVRGAMALPLEERVEPR
jgi:hypothetical protein